ncbi:hypothetical protein CSAL01_03956 [Colletotrichum salicis]|uniref:NmrA-like domain-containing protein n=1 Tax=Colletotrichum salicis TaxID=1209931 RepID=A0A135UXD0_9PEZI|nr:hypothetical protein CSAL01_03956 [Colletotrichum salicis]
MGIDLFILTRSIKPELENIQGVRRFVTDYSVASILEGIEGSVALVSNILDYPRPLSTFTRASSKPREAVRRASASSLPKEQTELERTLLSTGWFIDYVVPRRNRYLNDGGDAIPVNVAGQSMLIPGTGNEPLNMTAVRDVTRAVGKLLFAQSWERYTYISGGKATWNEVVPLMKETYPQMSVKYRSLAEYIENIVANPDPNGEERIISEYGIFSASRAGDLPIDKVAAHREKHFSGIKFRGPRELLAEVEKDLEVIV